MIQHVKYCGNVSLFLHLLNWVLLSLTVFPNYESTMLLYVGVQHILYLLHYCFLALLLTKPMFIVSLDFLSSMFPASRPVTTEIGFTTSDMIMDG